MGAAFWLAVAVIVGFRARRSQGHLKVICLLATILLVLFGISGLVDARTGAWWRPRWLLVWKGICLTGLILCLAGAWWLTRGVREAGPTGRNKLGDG